MGAPVICVVDNDESVRESLVGLLESVGFSVRPFDSSEAFLAADDVAAASCIVMDVSMPGMNGEELQTRLIADGRQRMIVFITAYAEEALCARLLGRGAAAFLVKPFGDHELLNAVYAATRSLPR